MKGTDKSTYKHATMDSQASDVIYANEDRNKLFRTALDERRILRGAESTRFGFNADFTHLEFMMAVREHNQPVIKNMQVNHLQGLYAFWAQLESYLKPLLKKFEAVSESYTSLIEDDSDMLSSMSELKIDFDLFEEYVKKHMSDDERIKYRHWAKVERAKIDEKVQRLVESEEARIAEAEDIKKRAKEV